MYTVQYRQMYVYEQREGTGLLEYRAMPSLPDVAHDGVLSTFRKKISPRPGQVHAWTVHHVQNHTLLGLGHSPLGSQAGRHVGPAL
jgi:hypothetical protein